MAHASDTVIRLLVAVVLLLIGAGIAVVAGGSIANLFEPEPHSDALLYITYGVVLFSIAAALVVAALRVLAASNVVQLLAVPALAAVGFPFVEAIDNRAGALATVVGAATLAGLAVRAWLVNVRRRRA